LKAYLDKVLVFSLFVFGDHLTNRLIKYFSQV